MFTENGIFVTEIPFFIGFFQKICVFFELFPKITCILLSKFSQKVLLVRFLL